MRKTCTFGLFAILICIGNLLCLPAEGQKYQLETKRIEFEEGLVSRTIDIFFEDSRGFMWFGSKAGLNRYDGNRLTQFTTDNGLLSNAIDRMAEDDQGQFWILSKDPIASRTIIQVFDPLLGKAKNLQEYLDVTAPFAESEVIGLGSHIDSPVLFILLKNSAIYQYSNHQFTLFRKKSAEEIQKVPRTIHYGKESVWLSDVRQMIRVNGLLDSDTLPFNNFAVVGPSDIGQNNELFYNLASPVPRQGSSTDQYLYLDGKLLYQQEKNFMNGRRLLGMDAYNGLIWTRDSIGGLVRLFNSELNEVMQFHPGLILYSRPNYIKFNSKGIGWLSRSGGVLMVRAKPKKFSNYLSGMNVFGQTGYGARGLRIEGDSLLTNGLGPSYKINLNTGERREFGPSGDFYRGGGGDQALLKRLVMHRDQNGDLWYTDESVRVAVQYQGTGPFRDYTYPRHIRDSAARQGRDIQVHWSAHMDRHNTLWLGRRHGMAYLKKDSSHLQSYRNYGGFEELEQASVFAFHENNEGLWIAATTGLYLMKKDKIIRRFYHDQNSSSLPANQIVHIREDETGALWLASRGGGIIKLSPDRSSYQQWTTDQGLVDNVVYATFEDDFGFLWASSNQGVMRIRLADMSVSVFKKAQGLIHDEFNTTSYYQSEDGRICFGSIDGVSCFKPKDFVEQAGTVQAVHWTGLQKQSRSDGIYHSSRDGIFDQNRITINPSELGFILDFTLLNYFSQVQGSFAYMIEGLDADWNYISEPSVHINALPYGSYQLKVKGQRASGYWTDARSVTLHIAKPVYLRWWFLMSLTIMLAAIVLLFIKRRIANLKKVQLRLEIQVAERTEQIREQAEELKKMDKLKSRFFANVSHELRTPLTLILGPVASMLENEELNEKGEESLKRVLRNGQSMSNLVEEILDLSKLDAKELEVSPRFTAVEEYFEVIFTNFLSQANYKDIAYQYHYEGEKGLTLMLDQRLVNRIVSNLLSNAFKFTNDGKAISLKVNSTSQDLLVEVTDSGVGISDKDLPHIFDRYFQTKETEKPVQGGSGIGLAISRELAELMDGDLKVTSTLNQGSTFSLRLPKTVYQGEFKLLEEIPADVEAEELQESELVFGQSKLLLVEDNADMRDFIKSELREFASIAEAGNGAEALVMLKEGLKPDLIISDLMMPVMDGMAFLKEVRSASDTGQIPLLMLTARSAEKDKLEAFSLGVDDYLIKPFSVEELKARLKNLLRNAKIRLDTQEEEPSKMQPHIAQDQELLKSIERLTQEGVHKNDFNIANVAREAGLSERQLQRKLKAQIGMSPVTFVKEVRLQMARNYLEEKAYLQVKDVSKAVGFSSVPYFSKMYKERFGRLPSSYFSNEP